MRAMTATSCVAALFALAMLALPTPVRADARADLLAAQQKMMDARFSVDMTIDDDGKLTRMHGEYDTVKRIHMKTPDAEIIMVPEGAWMRSDDGAWRQQPLLETMAKRFVPTSVEKMREDIRNVKDEGGREWQGQRVQVISWDIDTRVMLFKVKTHNLAFIDTQGRIIHTEAQSRRHGTTTRDIHYDDSIRVHAPS
jgi:hypothetical protein